MWKDLNVKNLVYKPLFTEHFGLLDKKNILKTYRHTHKQLCTIIIGNNLTEKNEEFESSKKIVLEVKTGVWKAFV